VVALQVMTEGRQVKQVIFLLILTLAVHIRDVLEEARALLMTPVGIWVGMRVVVMDLE
jgi:hypothetical protein